MSLEQQLKRQIDERDTDLSEALADQAGAAGGLRGTQRHAPRPQVGRSTSHQPIIQDGRRLADELMYLRSLLSDGDWTLIRLKSEHYATIAGEAALALEEFGA